MKRRWWLKPVFVIAAIAALLLYWRHWIHEQRIAEKAEARALHAKRSARQPRAAHPAPLPGAKHAETAHYVITTTADASQTERVANAVEALYAAYGPFFRTHMMPATGHDKLKLTLYAFQAQFKANNYSMPWAEAYYLRPVCYAYYAKGEPNPYHWMIHEATHQLNAEVAGFKKAKWIDEGLATYFGTSRIERGKLIPGKIDPDTDSRADHWKRRAEHQQQRQSLLHPVLEPDPLPVSLRQRPLCRVVQAPDQRRRLTGQLREDHRPSRQNRVPVVPLSAGDYCRLDSSRGHGRGDNDRMAAIITASIRRR